MNRENLTRWSLQALGFLAGVIVVGALEYVLLRLAVEVFGPWENIFLFYYGTGWVALPGFAGFYGARYLANSESAHPIRIAAVAAAAWTILVLTYFFFKREIDAPLSTDEVVDTLRWIVLPLVQAAIVWALYRWATAKAHIRP